MPICSDDILHADLELDRLRQVRDDLLRRLKRLTEAVQPIIEAAKAADTPFSGHRRHDSEYIRVKVGTVRDVRAAA